MDASNRKAPDNPKEKASYISNFFFVWTYKILKDGYYHVFGFQDICKPMKDDYSNLLGNRIERQWKSDLQKAREKNKKPSLLFTILKTFGKEYMWLAFLHGFSEIGVQLARPYFLALLLSYFKENSKTTIEEAYFAAVGIICSTVLYSLLLQHYFASAMRMGMKVRVACVSLIYRKCLKIGRTALGDISSGQIVNIVSNDVSRFEIVTTTCHYMWSAPLLAGIVAVILFNEIRWAGLFGILAVLIIVPLLSYVGSLSSKYRLQIALKTDERVRLTDEVIKGIQVIKMYAWEKPFSKLVTTARKSELDVVYKTSFLRGVYMTFNLLISRTVLFAALLAFILQGDHLTADQRFLMRKEKSQMRLNCDNNKNESDEKGYVNKILIEDVSASWYPGSNNPPTLESISCIFQESSLVGVIGSVGSGKSSFLQLILGEIEVLNGSIEVKGTVSYASQEAWIFNGSIKQNILFGLPFDKKRYKEVTKVCALERDFELLPRGDLTLVGERGASLSGGQKARVNLARAVYKNADVYLLDDPLSAVDTHVGKQLFSDCIKGYLANKTVILVTHQLQYINSVDHVILFHNGSIETQGNPVELENSGLDYASLISSEEEIKDSSSESEQEETSEKTKLISKISEEGSNEMKVTYNELQNNGLDSTLSVANREEVNESILANEHEDATEMTKMISRISNGSIKSGISDIDSISNNPPPVAEPEPEEISRRGHSVYLDYFRAGTNMCTVFLCFLLFIFSQVISSFADYYISFWTKLEEKRYSQNATAVYDNTLPSTTLASIHGALIAGICMFGLIRAAVFCATCMKCSDGLHNKMFNSVVGTAILFFNNNPSGRILNRFSKDLGMIDEWLPKCLMDFGQSMCALVGSLLIAIIVRPICIIPAVILSAICVFVRRFFVKTSKNLKRLEGIARSPVFSHLNSTLQGLPTIRALGAQSILQKEFDNHQDLHTSVMFLFIYTSAGFTSFLDLSCAIFVSCVTFSVLAIRHTGIAGEGANAGLAITQAMSVAALLQWCMRSSSEIANQMTSTERVLEYASLPSEEPDPNSKKRKEDVSNWPTDGKIQFNHLNLYYVNDDSPVLKDLCLEIKPREKIGVVGRTGAGKSSIIQALFRMTHIKGEILIDGIDTKTLTLECLRSHISIIPQDPVLFSGTMRHNLDPFEQYEDFALWKALDDVEMRESLKEEYDLETDVKDGGGNFSLGQRQLVCLARAIVRNNKILLMDEATANVDPQTDALIQRTIQNKFSDCTVLTIAHRLNTIMDSDKVLVMEAGEAVEFDHPHTLLQNENGYFFKLVQETGPAMSKQLTEMAKRSYLQR
ncbi:ATP-binding cassette sub-family C member 4-like isoform X2 [Lycorma delicatula]|uniref:ATP-binding cassette sub-family C member 4-like isoform X2 n=1 Tax=Lycorma delicatula TaxID=130591 RepID=UPI003F511FEB